MSLLIMFILICEIACALALKEMFGIRILTGFSEKNETDLT